MAGHAQSSSHHIVPISVYTRTIVMLAFLMGLTILAARLPYLNEASGLSKFMLGTAAGSWVANIVALGIATAKAFLVVSIFMGYNQGTKLVKFWALIGFVWFFLLFVAYLDYGTRKWEPVPSWTRDPGSAMPRNLGEARDRTLNPEGVPIRARP